MILETTEDDYVRFVLGAAPRHFQLADTAISSPDILKMLADVASRVWAGFSPASWLILEGGELVGLCAITRPPKDGCVDIGYGIAPSRRGLGYATRAVGEIARWASDRADIVALTAETSTANLASQRVLEANGFVRTGERVDDEDGQLICWRRVTI